MLCAGEYLVIHPGSRSPAPAPRPAPRGASYPTLTAPGATAYPVSPQAPRPAPSFAPASYPTTTPRTYGRAPVPQLAQAPTVAPRRCRRCRVRWRRLVIQPATPQARFRPDHVRQGTDADAPRRASTVSPHAVAAAKTGQISVRYRPRLHAVRVQLPGHRFELGSRPCRPAPAYADLPLCHPVRLVGSDATLRQRARRLARARKWRARRSPLPRRV